MTTLRPKVGEKYIHYKTPDKEYEIVAIGKDKPSYTDMVAYRALYPVTDLGEEFAKDPVFIRTLENFCEILPDGKKRFQKV